MGQSYVFYEKGSMKGNNYKNSTYKTQLNKLLKDRNKENKKKYSKQWNYCVSLLKKSK